MVDVRKVYVTSEAAKTLDISTQYCLKMEKDLRAQGVLSEFDLQESGERNHLFSAVVVAKLKDYFSIN